MLTSVPIALAPSPADYASGVVDAQGVMRFDAEILEIEYCTHNRSFETGAVQKATIALDDLESMQWQPGLLGNKITLQVRRMAALEGMIGTEGSRVTLRIARKDRQAAARFVSRIEIVLSERRLRDLDS